jgi:hypothetical protein
VMAAALVVGVGVVVPFELGFVRAGFWWGSGCGGSGFIVKIHVPIVVVISTVVSASRSIAIFTSLLC